MAEPEIHPTTPEEYNSSPKEKLIKLSSGFVFRCRKPSAEALLSYMILNEDIPKSEEPQIKAFYTIIKKNYKVILSDIVLPSVVEPKLAPEDYHVEDVIELTTKLLEMAGVNKQEEKARESFRQ